MTVRGRLVALEGPSGAGKSTIVRLLADREGWSAMPEAFSRLESPPPLDFRSPAELLRIESVLLDEEGRRYREARRWCRRGEDVIADTNFLGPLTYTAGLVALGRAPPSVLGAVHRAVRRRLLRGELGWPDGIVYLDLPFSELRHRAARDPIGHPEPLATRHRSVARFERRFYLRVLSKRWPDRSVRVPADAPPAAVVERVSALAGGFPRTAPPIAERMDLVDLLGAGTRESRVRAARAPATLKSGTSPPRAPRR